MAKTSTLKLSGEISEKSATDLVALIEAVPENQKIQLRIASPGGSIFDGVKIMTALRAHKGGVDTLNESLAASMASAIFMLGKSRTMAKGSRLMIHRPWAGNMSGESNDLRKQADLLDSLEKDLVATYAVGTGLPEDRVQEMMEAETWFTADEAKELGFATAIAGEMKNAIPAEFLSKFEHVPSELLPAPEPEPVDLEASVQNLTSELACRTKERDDARASLARSKVLMEALKRSYGLGAAAVIANTPSTASDALASVYDRYESIQDPEGKSAFYAAHRAELLTYINRAPQKNK